MQGEGELKILQRILDLPPAWELGDGQEPESHMILGADSDLLLMAMVSGGVVALRPVGMGCAERTVLIFSRSVSPWVLDAWPRSPS